MSGWYDGALRGVFALNGSLARSHVHTTIGARPAFVA